MTLIPRGTLSTIPGITVGHWTDTEAQTGCTTIVLPIPNVTSCEVRGAAPATRETALLAPGMSVQAIDAIVLTGGSAFGLAAADGVIAALERDDRGYPTKAGVVPIVCSAALYDLGVGDSAVRPTAKSGDVSYHSVTSSPVETGQVGAGTGATVSKWRGDSTPGGLGSAAVAVGDTTVAALVAVNAIGDVFSVEGESLTGGSAVPGPLEVPPPVGENTTLAVIATDAALDRLALQRLCVRAHDAFGACLRPAHTAFDGDVCFATSVGREVDGAAEPDVIALAEAAFEATARAIEFAVRPPS